MTSRRPLVMVSGSFWPREGGAERQMRAILDSVATSLRPSSVVTQVLEGEPRRARVGHVRVWRAGSSRLFRSTPRLAQFWFLLSATVRALSLRPGLLLSVQFGSATVAASLVARATSSAHIVRLTGGGTARHRSEPEARSSSSTGRLIVRFVTANPRCVVVAPAQHLLDDLAEFFPRTTNELVHIPNGVPDPPPQPLRRRPVGVRQGVVWYARAGSESSDSLFLRVVRAMPGVQFSVVGRRLDADEPNLRLLGWLDDVAPVLDAALVVLNTSRTEGAPNFVLQGLAAGCRVVAVDNRGLREVARGFPSHVELFPADDAEAGVETIGRALAREQVEAAARPATVRQVFGTWEELIRRMM